MLKTCQICDGKIADASPENCRILIYTKPDEAEKRTLIDEFKIDEHTLHSALDPDELARLEFEPEHLAVIFKQPRNHAAEEHLLFRVISVGLFLLEDRLIVVQSEDLPLFEGRQFLTVGSLPGIVLKCLAGAVAQFFEHLKVINQMSDNLERKINAAMENRYLLNLFTLEKGLVYYLNAINSNGALIERLKTNARRIGFTTEEVEFLDDVTIENNQCARQAEIYSNILASLMDARASVVSNNLNVLMKTLNFITIGIMAPSFVVAAFSMKVGTPFEGHPNAFWIILGLALLTEVWLLIFWRWKKW
jgi:magnesium transporter